MRIITTLFALCALALPATAAASGSGSSAQKHQLDMYKVEHYVEVDANDYDDDISVSCNGTDYAVDGMWRVDYVAWNAQIMDEGPYGPWNRYNGVDAFASFSDTPSRWHFGMRNDTEEPVQIKLWVTCLGNPTNPAEGDSHKHTFTISNPYEDTQIVPAGTVAGLDAGGHQCASGEIAVAPGFNIKDAQSLKLFRSWPADSAQRGWELGFYAPNDPEVTTSIRCLRTRTNGAGARNHRHAMRTRFRQTTLTVPKDFTSQLKLDCGEQEKALIGAFDIKLGNPWGAGYDDHWLWFIGMEPQIKSRVFHVQNHSTGADYQAKIGALCVNDRTGNRIY